MANQLSILELLKQLESMAGRKLTDTELKSFNIDLDQVNFELSKTNTNLNGQAMQPTEQQPNTNSQSQTDIKTNTQNGNMLPTFSGMFGDITQSSTQLPTQPTAQVQDEKIYNKSSEYEQEIPDELQFLYDLPQGIPVDMEKCDKSDSEFNVGENMVYNSSNQQISESEVEIYQVITDIPKQNNMVYMLQPTQEDMNGYNAITSKIIADQNSFPTRDEVKELSLLDKPSQEQQTIQNQQQINQQQINQQNWQIPQNQQISQNQQIPQNQQNQMNQQSYLNQQGQLGFGNNGMNIFGNSGNNQFQQYQQYQPVQSVQQYPNMQQNPYMQQNQYMQQYQLQPQLQPQMQSQMQPVQVDMTNNYNMMYNQQFPLYQQNQNVNGYVNTPYQNNMNTYQQSTGQNIGNSVLVGINKNVNDSNSEKSEYVPVYIKLLKERKPMKGSERKRRLKRKPSNRGNQLSVA